MGTEKNSHKPKSGPVQKKSPEKKEALKAQKECRVESRKELSKLQLEHLKDNVGHKVKPGENLWKIIYDHAKETGKKPIHISKLKNINITPGDKIYFSNDEVTIKYLSGGTKKIPFEKLKSNNCSNEKDNNKPLSLEEEIKLGEQNERNLEKILKKEDDEAKKLAEKQKKETKELPKLQQTIFDKDSPLVGDKIAYKHEIEIRKAYSDKITEIVNKHCKGSIIDENFLYGVMARESRFDKKAVSHTGVKGLGQLTNDTVLTIANINEAKSRKYPEYADFYIYEELRTWVPPRKKSEKGHYKLNNPKVLNALNQIKLTISYLLYLEDMFSDVKDKEFKAELIITSYNLGPGKTKEIFDNYRGVKNWEGLKQALERAQNKGVISKEKYKEVVEYVPKVKEYIKLASLSNRKVA